jgi:hypothetical protein
MQSELSEIILINFSLKIIKYFHIFMSHGSKQQSEKPEVKLYRAAPRSVHKSDTKSKRVQSS